MIVESRDGNDRKLGIVKKKENRQFWLRNCVAGSQSNQAGVMSPFGRDTGVRDKLDILTIKWYQVQPTRASYEISMRTCLPDICIIKSIQTSQLQPHLSKPSQETSQTCADESQFDMDVSDEINNCFAFKKSVIVSH